MRRLSFALIVVSALCLCVSAQSPNPSPDPVEVTYRGSAVEWAPLVPMEGAVLTVSGPDRFYLRQSHRSGARPVFAAVDGQGLARPDGTYRWELVVERPAPEPNQGISGSFLVQAGTILPLAEGEKAVMADGSIEATKGMPIDARPGSAAVSGRPIVALETEGSSNNFFGIGAGASITTGGANSFFGASAGQANTEGSWNSFFGAGAGAANTTGYQNSFFGDQAGSVNQTGTGNSFFGEWAGHSNVGGTLNAFFGRNAGQYSDGWYNCAFGSSAGRNISAGWANSFVGTDAGTSNTVESNNTAVGAFANINPGSNPSTNPVTNATAIGYRAYVGQSNSLVLGSINGVNSANSSVNVGIGTSTPARQLHLAGPNAVFRMDRTSDTASFILVRTDATGATPWKTFVVGTNASGVNQGEFIINDIGTAVGGGGLRRMTITNAGDVQFTGTVYAPVFSQTSSLAFKTNIRTFENALETVSRLRGVRFDWKESGEAGVGLIAEEVNEVVPEIVTKDSGKATGVNYANLVAVLVEAVKEQQRTIQEERAANREERRKNAEQQTELARLKARVARLEALSQAE